MIRQHIRAPCDGFDHGNIEAFGQRGKFVDCTRILHAAARDDNGAFGVCDDVTGRCDFILAGTLAADFLDLFVKEPGRVVIGPALYVLWQADERRPAIGGVEHRCQSIGQRLYDLRRMRDAIPITGHGLEGIVHAERRVAEVFKLLQNRIGQAGLECVTA